MSLVFCDRATAFGDIAWLTGAGSDPQIPDGIHWHVTMGQGGGLPAGPAVIVDVQTNSDSFRGGNPTLVFGKGGPGNWQIDADQGQELTLVFDKPAPGPEVLGWALIQAEGELTLSAADPRLTRQGLWSTNAARSKPDPADSARWRLASADCQVVRITGHGRVIEASAYWGLSRFDLDHNRVLSRASLARDTAQQIPYYLPARDGSDDWEFRASASAPLYRLPSDPDRPGELEPDPDRELYRIRSIATPQPGSGVVGVETWCRTAYGALDSGVRGIVSGENGGTRVSQAADETYLQASVDPGVARWQGLSGTLDREPEHTDAGPMGLAAAFIPVYRLFGPRESAVPQEAEAEKFYDEEIGGFFDLQQTARDFPRLGDGSRWELTLLVVPLPYLRECPQDRPEAPEILPLDSSWNAVTADQWAATVGIGRLVPRGEVAFVQTEPTPATMHPGEADAPEPMIAGFSKPHGRHVVTAAGIPGGYPSVTVGVSLQDWIGRWGDRGEAVLDRPARPPVPPPQGSTLVIPGIFPDGGAPASSATVRAEIKVQWPAGPGAVPLTGLRVAVPREPVPRVLAIGQGDMVKGMVTRAVEFAAAETIPGEVAVDTVTIQSVDAEGRASAAVAITARIVDPRPIRAPLASSRLIATARRGNDPSVTVTLSITAAPNARAYRILLAGETTLRRAFGLSAPDPSQPRAERAAAILRAMPDHDQRRFYSWASVNTHTVLNGAAKATIELPAGTDGVVFARAVAVTTIPGNPPTESVSTPFGRTKPVAIIVPRSDFPPVPGLRTSVDGEGTATVTVRVTRPSAAVLSSLRIDGGQEVHIQARLVEYLANAEPVFWPQITTLILKPSAGNPGIFEGTATLRGRPWQRTAVAASVRYPAEPTLAAGDIAIENGEIRPVGLQYEHIPSPWGPYSTPAWIDFHGNVPTIEYSYTFGTVAVTASGLPALPSGAPPWTMQLLRGTASLAPDPRPGRGPRSGVRRSDPESKAPLQVRGTAHRSVRRAARTRAVAPAVTACLSKARRLSGRAQWTNSTRRTTTTRAAPATPAQGNEGLAGISLRCRALPMPRIWLCVVIAASSSDWRGARTARGPDRRPRHAAR
ncbi:hypothetical protein [Arthrobacter sp. OAP107]|uniref:hypothetical protein n=1 Tax=Arthrobacter sp. OAP107 TaxID=3156445 RepID=UPI003397BCC7